jgi:hypothetical protein
MKRVLMVTPVWPPLGAIGVRRVVRLARHLPAYGWAPVVLTDAPTGSGKPRPPHLDATLVPPPVEVHHAAGVMAGARLRRNVSDLLGHLDPRAAHVFLRATAGLPLPDHYPAWAPAAVRAARRLDPVDAVWTTGEPFGMFVVGAAVAAALGKPLVLDYRDLWTQAGAPPARTPLRWPAGVAERLEGWLLHRASGVAYVNADMQALNERAFGVHRQSAVIPNGYDSHELADVVPLVPARPTLLQAGGCYGGRTFAPVVEALAAGFGPDVSGEKGLQIQYFGEVDARGQAALAAHDLSGRVEVHARVAAAEIARRLKGATALLLIGDSLHTHALTGKLFDYIAAGRPILGVGPAEAAAGRLIREAGLGRWVDERDLPAVIAALRAVEAGGLPYGPRAEVLHPYTARAMAERTAALLDAA